MYLLKFYKYYFDAHCITFLSINTIKKKSAKKISVEIKNVSKICTLYIVYVIQ